MTMIAAPSRAIDAGPVQGSVPPARGFGALKQIDAGVLTVGYAEAGPASGPPVILLHGWPYDIHSYMDVARCSHRAATGSSSRICAQDWYPVAAAARNVRRHGAS
jgi:pimeloyl-ACP methyl ester carboxylesterase